MQRCRFSAPTIHIEMGGGAAVQPGRRPGAAGGDGQAVAKTSGVCSLVTH